MKFCDQLLRADGALFLNELDKQFQKSPAYSFDGADHILRVLGWLRSLRGLGFTVAVFLVVGSGLLRIGWLLFHWCSPMVRVGSEGAGESCASREELDTREMLGGFSLTAFDGFRVETHHAG